jgi:hypothetical protein
VPDLSLAAQTDGEVAAGRREGERCDLRSEGEVVDGDAAQDVGQDSVTIFVDGEEEVAAGGEADSTDVFSVGEGERVRFVPAKARIRRSSRGRSHR